MESYEELLDLHKSSIQRLEKDLCIIQDNLMTLSEQLKETQRYLIKLAQNQAEMNKRVAAWPYIVVNTKESKE